MIFFVGTAIGGGQIFSASDPLIKAKPIKWQPDFFPSASSLNGNDYLEFAFRLNIRPADTGYPAAGEKNLPQNPAAGKKNIAQVKRCVTVNSKGLRCNDFSPSRTLRLIQNIVLVGKRHCRVL
ncbi:hypothetical protein [Microcoleus asticus]|uniref:Uncharacterized protein n=1 Tax=Microcoleus asticus IPMA8 TaxID=2563858 RepID=A0ABX2CXZ7_9CYAN|nr:hypothetical protein [Microcoleus asticus]NQE35048.1 hypothetical protein [Microcoleus asticus IPMA8]